MKTKSVLSLARMWSGIDGAVERDQVRVYVNTGSVWCSGRHGAFTKKPTLGRHKLMPSKCARLRPDIAEHKRRLALEMAWARKAAELCLGHLDGGASAAAIEREAAAYAYSSVGPLRGAK